MNPSPGSDPAELLSLAKLVQAEVNKVCPDQCPLKMRSVALLVGEAYLQTAALDKVVADLHRRPPPK